MLLLTILDFELNYERNKPIVDTTTLENYNNMPKYGA